MEESALSSSISNVTINDLDSKASLPEVYDCTRKLRVNPRRRKEKVYIGCGAGFGGDRPTAALRLLERVKELDYLVLECLAERTLADRFKAMKSGGQGYDPRISEWMTVLLPLAMERGVRIITNMGARDAFGAQEEVLRLASRLGISITVGVARQFSVARSGLDHHLRNADDGVSVYMGAAPIVECLEKYRPNVIITSRVADASLFLAPMIYELGWNWDELHLLAQGSMAGHLLECGCQLTGGYFMHPGDKYRDISFSDLLNLSLPFAEVSYDGKVCVAKAEGSGGVLNFGTCAEQLLYEVGDPSAYITPDVVIDFRDVSFKSLSNSKVLCAGARPSVPSVPDKLLLLASKPSGWKGWGEISYGGYECVKRAKAAEFLVRSWMEETCPGVNNRIISYIIGLDSLKATSNDKCSSFPEDVRLHIDGVFEREEQAIQFTKEFTALYTNGPAGGGGISTGHTEEIILEKRLVAREQVNWHITVKQNEEINSNNPSTVLKDIAQMRGHDKLTQPSFQTKKSTDSCTKFSAPPPELSPAPSGEMIPLYDVAHSRAGDKGNDINLSIIPHFGPDFDRLKMIITPRWVKEVVSALLIPSSFPNSDDIKTRDKWVDEHVIVEIYDVRGVCSLNVVVRNILDGGVNCSRRIDRHGKSISDLLLCQQVVLPP